MLEKIYELKELLLAKRKLILISSSISLGLIILGVLSISLTKEEKIEELSVLEPEEKKEEICRVDIKGYIENSGLYEIECNRCVNDVIKLAGGLKENADTSVINLSKKVKDGMVIVIYSNSEVASFIEVKQEEKIKEEKCVNVTVVSNDACIKKEDRVDNDINVTVEEDTNSNDNVPRIISINTATKEDLMSLKGVGESKAIAIIEYRNEHGLFTSIEELKNVKGIGEKMFEKIKDFITL